MVHVQLRWQGGMRFGSEDGRWSLDVPPEQGGSGAGPAPMETVLAALAGCTGMDVVAILQKMREPLEELQVEVEGERAQEHPRVYTRVHVRYRFAGARLRPEAVARAVRLSQERYCPVSAMLRASVSVTYEVELNGTPLAL
jgi:putative redox protein